MYNKYAEEEYYSEDFHEEKQKTDPLSFIKKLIPDNIDRHDLALLGILFLLYIESDDSDFLIVLAVIAFSMFKKSDGSLF